MNLSKSLFSCVVFTMASAATLTAQAASPTFANGTFTDDSVLSLPGTELYGIAVGNSSDSIDVAGYTFLSSTTTTAQDDVTGINNGGGFTGFLNGTSSGNSSFDEILNTGLYYGSGTDGDSSSGNYTLNGLIGGDTYSVLIFTADDRPAGSGYANFEITDGTATSALQLYAYADGNGNDQTKGGYVVDTFVEGGTGTGLSHSIFVDNTSPPAGVELSGLLVANVTTPEPSTYALVGLGLALLLTVVRKRLRL